MDGDWYPDRLPAPILGATTGIALGLVVALLLGAMVESPVPEAAPEEVGDDQLVEVENETRAWPYVSSRPSFQSRAAAVNVVVMASPDRVRGLMTREAESDWRRPPEDRPAEARLNVSGATDPEKPSVQWSEAGDTKRYLYVEVANESDWQGDRYQLQIGDYLGAQHHIRVFGATELRNVTLMQVHQEHWDWFTLSHTVDSLTNARQYVRNDLDSVPVVSRVEDVGVGNFGTYDSDGNLIVVWLGLLLPAAAVTRQFRDDLSRLRAILARPAPIALFAGVAASYLWIRAAGLVVERYELTSSLDTVAAGLYLALVLGPPLAAGLLGRRLAPGPAYGMATAGLATAFVLDYAYLGIVAIPTSQLLYRLAVVGAVALVAAGGARQAETGERLTLAAGLLAWALALAWPLLGYV